MEKSFCMRCKKEVKGNIKKCKCGGESFVFGNTLEVVDGKIQCQCGNNAIKRGCHMDYTNKYVDSGSCSKCGSPIGIETYRDKESMMLWGDDEEYEETVKSTKYAKRVANRQKLYNKNHKIQGDIMLEVSNGTVITGASDDLIEISGELEEEFNAYDCSDGTMAFSDGTLLTVVYDQNGIWRFIPIYKGDLFEKEIIGSVGEDTNDEVYFKTGLKWCVFSNDTQV